MTGGRGEVKQHLRRGFECFLVNDVPKYALTDDVEVVCDDGVCFGCMIEQFDLSNHPLVQIRGKQNF